MGEIENDDKLNHLKTHLDHKIGRLGVLAFICCVLACMNISHVLCSVVGNKTDYLGSLSQNFGYFFSDRISQVICHNID